MILTVALLGRGVNWIRKILGAYSEHAGEKKDEIEGDALQASGRVCLVSPSRLSLTCPLILGGFVVWAMESHERTTVLAAGCDQVRL
jgi:hypothetical protein